MRSFLFGSIALLALITAGVRPASALDVTSVVDIGLDAVFFRPLGAVSTVAGAVLMVPAAVLTAPTGEKGIDEAWNTFVVHQYQSTFERPLGDF